MANSNNRLSGGVVEAADFHCLNGGQILKSIVGTVARTDTSAKSLGSIPPGAQIIGAKLFGGTGSDAGTTATVSLGFSGGTGAEILSAQNVKGAAGVGMQGGTAALIPAIATATKTVTAIYAETGTAATTGGPWTVVVEFVSNL